MRLQSATQINEKKKKNDKERRSKGEKEDDEVCACVCVRRTIGVGWGGDYEAKEQPQWLTPQAKTGSALVSIALTA